MNLIFFIVMFFSTGLMAEFVEIPYAYVVNTEGYTVSTIDTTTTIGPSPFSTNIGPSPLGSAISPDHSRIYVTNVRTISIIRTTDNVELDFIGATSFSALGDIVITNDGDHAYVGLRGHDGVDFFDGIAVIDLLNYDPFLNGPQYIIDPSIVTPAGIALTPDGSTLYVVSSGNNTLVPISIPSNVVGTPIAVGSMPHSVAINPDGTKAYVTNSADNNVTVITLATQTPGPNISVGLLPYGIAITPDGTKAYVANNASNFVTPINLITNTAGPGIIVGGEPYSVQPSPQVQPFGVAITPDGTTAYVTCFGYNTCTPIDVATDTAAANSLNIGVGPTTLLIADVTRVRAAATDGAREVTSEIAQLLGLNPQPNQGLNTLIAEIAPIIIQ